LCAAVPCVEYWETADPNEPATRVARPL